jgi:hypothetical protein
MIKSNIESAYLILGRKPYMALLEGVRVLDISQMMALCRRRKKRLTSSKIYNIITLLHDIELSSL